MYAYTYVCIHVYVYICIYMYYIYTYITYVTGYDASAKPRVAKSWIQPSQWLLGGTRRIFS